MRLVSQAIGRVPQRLLELTLGVVLGASGFIGVAQAQPSSEQLLPSETVFHVSVQDVGQLISAFEASDYGRLFDEPELREFLQDVKAQLQQKFASELGRLGVRFQDLQDVRARELSYATLLEGGETGDDGVGAVGSTSIFLADVRENEAEALQLLGKITRNLVAEGATEQPGFEVDGVSVQHYQLKRQGGEIRVPRVFVGHTQGWILVGNRQSGLETVIRSVLRGRAAEPLNRHPGYRQIRQRLAQTLGSTPPQVTWFASPFALARVIRDDQVTPGPASRYIQAMEKTGFDSIQGIGGTVNFGFDGNEIFYQTLIAVPGRGDLESRLAEAARILSFSPKAFGGWQPPGPWVRDTAASVLSWTWDSGTAFNAAAPLVDSLYDEGTFQKVVDDIRKSENTQVDLPRLAASLGPHWHATTEIVPPLTGDSEKILLAMQVNDPEGAIPNLRNYLQADWYEPRVVTTSQGQVELWEFSGEPDLIANDPLENLLDPSETQAAEEADEERLFLGMSTFAIVENLDYILAANDPEYLLEAIQGQRPLAGTPAYQIVQAKLASYHDGPASFYRFAFPDRVHELSYELLRRGELTKSDITLERGLRALFETEKGVIRKQEIDPGKMPADYQRIVAPHLGPTGWMLWVEDSGWYIAGLALPRS